MMWHLKAAMPISEVRSHTAVTKPLDEICASTAAASGSSTDARSRRRLSRPVGIECKENLRITFDQFAEAVNESLTAIIPRGKTIRARHEMAAAGRRREE